MVSGGNTIAVFNGGQPGIYGQQGIPAATNTPGARTGALGWTDASGNCYTLRHRSSHNTTHPFDQHRNGRVAMELAFSFPCGTANTGRRPSLAGKASQALDGGAAGNGVCRIRDAHSLWRRIILHATGLESPGDIDRYSERHVWIDPAGRHRNADGKLECSHQTKRATCW